MHGLPFYIAGIGQHECQPYLSKPNGHPRDQFFYGTKGNGILKIYEKSVKLPAGCGFYIPPYVPHTYYPLEDEWDLRWVSCGGDGVKSVCDIVGIRPGVAYLVQDATVLDSLLNRMHTELVCDEEYGNYFASAYLNEFILSFARQCGTLPKGTGQETAENTFERKMAIIKDYVEYHFMYAISMQDLCDLLQITPQHLCRIVKTCTGKRPTEYINMVRIENAKNMLIGTDFSVEKIAGASGFENTNYFCKIFKRQTGMTPKQYRFEYDPDKNINIE